LNVKKTSRLKLLTSFTKQNIHLQLLKTKLYKNEMKIPRRKLVAIECKLPEISKFSLNKIHSAKLIN